MPDHDRLPTGGKIPVYHTSTRWLKWDGIPDLNGTCNQNVAPIDATLGSADPNLIHRLNHLGFDCEVPSTDQQKEKVWMALKEILGYLNVPALTTFNYSKNARPASWEADIQSLVNLHAKAELEKLDDEMDSTEYKAWGYTLKAYFGAKVKSAPKVFQPMRESAGIEVELAGMPDIKSMVLRILPATGTTPVYQEFFDEDAVAGLPKLKPKTGNLIKHHPYKNFLMTQKRNELGGLFTRMQDKGQPNVAPALQRMYNRAFGPYTVEIWISNEADTFPKGPDGIFAAAHDKPFRTDAEWPGTLEAGANEIGKSCSHHSPAFLSSNALVLFEDFANRISADALNIYSTLWARAKQHKAQHCQDKASKVCDPNSNCKHLATCSAGDWGFPEIAGTFVNISRHIERLRQQFCCGEFSNPDPGPLADLKAQVPSVLEDMENRIGELHQANYPYRQCITWIGQFVDAIEHITSTVWIQPEIAHYRKVYPGPSSLPGTLGSMPEETKLLILGRNNAEVWRTQINNDIIEPGFPKPRATLQETYRQGIRRGSNDFHLPQILSKQEAIVLPSYNPLDTVFFRKTRQVPLYVLALIDFKYLIADRTYMTPQNFFNHDCFHVVGTEMYNHANLQLWDTLQDDVKDVKLPLAQSNSYTAAQEDIYRYWDHNAKLLDAVVADLDGEVAELERQHRNLSRDEDADPSDVSAKAEALKGRKAFRDAVNVVLFTLLHEPVNRTNLQMPPMGTPLVGRDHRWCVMPEEDLFAARLDAKGPQGQDNGFLRAILDRFHSGFFGRIREEEYYQPAQVAAIQDAVDCTNCQAKTCTGTTHTGKPCVKGWITENIPALQSFPDWMRENLPPVVPPTNTVGTVVMADSNPDSEIPTNH